MIPLVRRWAVDWLASQDASVCESVFSPDYRLRIGAVELDGRDAYMQGTLGQLNNYPGLVFTVHEVITSGELAAVRFTEHGAAAHRDGALAAWRGIVLHRARGGLIGQSWAEEDYASRQRQLTGDGADAIEPPAIAPWDTVEGAPDVEAEQVVRSWLAAGPVESDAVLFDEGAPRALPPLELDVLFSSGRAVAFHGSAVHDDGIAQGVSGLVRVGADGAVSGRVVTDRAGAAAARKRKG